ncbi:MAG: GHMP kinase [Thermoguttaceae bacterium]|jgi:D-glycero-alpha-D-manno-heptose-7-phosphate kinase
MIISKSPLRISFFGGGTDFPEFFGRHGGAVLGTAIDKHIYHSVVRFPSELFDYSIRLAYRKVECVRSRDEIEHIPFRRILEHFGIEKDIEVTLAADLPSFSGLGSSSTFTVGLINALSAHQGRFMPKQELARLAIQIERDVLQEAVGCQDQIFAAYGSLNLIEFPVAGEFVVHRICLPKSRLHELDNSLLLFFTGMTRRAGDIERSKLQNLHNIEKPLLRMLELVEKAHSLLTGNAPLSEFGRLLDRTWQEKRTLDAAVSHPEIDRLYDLGMAHGALGGKLLGAGGGGFMLFFVPEEEQPRLRKAMTDYYEIPFSISAPGSSIIHS